MNRVGVIKSVISNGTPAIGGLLITPSNAEGTYLKPSVVALDVFLNDLSKKHLGVLNPRKFKVESQAYVAAGNKVIVLGYNGTSGNLVCADPSIATNLNKFGTLTISELTSAGTGYIPKWGTAYQEDIYIKAGDTTATIYTRLVAAATKIAAKINAKYGAGTVTFTSSISDSNKYLSFTFANKLFSATLDGIFDGTSVTVTPTDFSVPIMNGAAVIVKEKEAAVLDGYNPIQTDKFQTFNIANYTIGAIGSTYDCVLIHTTSDSKYESPTFTEGWDLDIEIYCVRAGGDTNGQLGAVAAALVAALKVISDAVSSYTVDEADTAIAAAIAAIP